MNITSYELIVVEAEFVTAYDIVWRRYRGMAIGIVEAMLSANYQLSVIHRTTPFLPPGTMVRVPIDPVILASRGIPATPNIWGSGS